MPSEPEPQHLDALIQRAGARCECTGECGENHAWTAGILTQRCRAPHGCNIRRKIDHPTSWVLAELQGWEDNRDERAQLTDADGQVTRGGRTWSLAYPELYRPRIVHVLLAAVELPEGRRAAFCQRCVILLERRKPS
jgi:hypothetical protein